ncbi:hypothetical protein [Roseivivax sediminis]|uniref:Uncharacterized protein n=1 Tax=Roseivivax sediminis TaxID=936889 RepID=A0A1I1ZD46_9RHOB|nr:hypothetical protein [Roseivivax sediminis]SFE29512.1 hypothetical protein SAMN04515678_10894 [Roseivivax sediminis]
MTAQPVPLAQLPSPTREIDDAARLPDDEAALLDMLRRTAARCRATPRADLFRACALLGAERSVAAPRFAEALLRTLDQGLGRPVRIYKRGSTELSFDERWLLALIAAFRRDDDASATFLVSRRLTHASRRSIGFLARGLSMGLEPA